MSPRHKCFIDAIRHRSTRLQLLPLLVATLVGCSGRSAELPPAPVSWPTGVYALEATIEYRTDSSSESRTIRDHHTAVLDIGPGGVMTLVDSSGGCRGPITREAQGDEEQRGKFFRCRGSEYVLEMSDGTLGGEIAATVTERVRLQEGCSRYRIGTTQCREYRWVVQSGIIEKRAQLTVTPRS